MTIPEEKNPKKSIVEETKRWHCIFTLTQFPVLSKHEEFNTIGKLSSEQNETWWQQKYLINTD